MLVSKKYETEEITWYLNLGDKSNQEEEEEMWRLRDRHITCKDSMVPIVSRSRP